jgi:hypothetical protein
MPCQFATRPDSRSKSDAKENDMTIRTTRTVLLSLLLATGAYAVAQDEPKAHEGAPAAQQAPETKPEGMDKPDQEKPQDAKPDKADKDRKDMDRDQNDQGKQQDQEKDKQAKPDSKPDRDAGQAREMNGRSDDAHNAGKSARIPDDKFRAHFGSQHHFSVGHPTMINNRPGFKYGGYSFDFVDAWPAGWAYTDDCYVDYIDGQYFLIDLLHPGVRLALIVVI